MALSNFERMLRLAGDVFDVKNDPSQLDVNEKVMKRLLRLHPATMSEYNDGKGPVVWILVIPTSLDLMNRFLNKKITEQEILDLTRPDTSYEAIYLCSALVLEEYRRKGIARKLTLEAIESIRKKHPIQSLFVWPFSTGGDALAKSIASLTGLPLKVRKD
jgi:ribosomal protein S18 acetylase RimI-like enzyme